MSEFLGSRISLISKSDIRYSGVLHEINSEESTVSLENVISYGTEGRKGKPEEEIAPADQVYEYIVFRGSDVKDLRIEEGPTSKDNKPPAVPNDPAIVGARPRPANAAAPGLQQQGPRGGMGAPAPGPAPGFGANMGMPPPAAAVWGQAPPRQYQYPPPPGWYPPGPGFPPGGPGPWNNFYPPVPPGAPGGMPGGPPGGPPGMPQPNRQPLPQTPENKPTPIGAGPDKAKPVPPVELSSEPKSLGQQPPMPGAPAPPVESKPSVEEVKATAASLAAQGQASAAPEASRTIPTGPRMTRITPAVPLPAALVNKATHQTTTTTTTIKQSQDQTPANTAALLKDATQAAKAAVAVAMAQLQSGSTGHPAQQQQQQHQQPQQHHHQQQQQQQQQQHPNGNAMDNLTRKVNEMRVNAAARAGGSAARGGRGRGGRPGKVEVPAADFDFESANAKFSKEDLVKEAIAGSPLGEAPNGSLDGAKESTSTAVPAEAYNKSRSFFDNISSEARERAENGGQKPGGREWRGEEQRKNMETFGQGSVDGGYRGYRGRGGGRGRGGMRGRGGGGGYGQGRGGGRGGYRRDNQAATGSSQ